MGGISLARYPHDLQVAVVPDCDCWICGCGFRDVGIVLSNLSYPCYSQLKLCD